MGVDGREGTMAASFDCNLRELGKRATSANHGDDLRQTFISAISSWVSVEEIKLLTTLGQSERNCRSVCKMYARWASLSCMELDLRSAYVLNRLSFSPLPQAQT